MPPYISLCLTIVLHIRAASTSFCFSFSYCVSFGLLVSFLSFFLRSSLSILFFEYPTIIVPSISRTGVDNDWLFDSAISRAICDVLTFSSMNGAFWDMSKSFVLIHAWQLSLVYKIIIVYGSISTSLFLLNSRSICSFGYLCFSFRISTPAWSLARKSLSPSAIL